MSCRKPTPQLPATQLCRCGAWSSRPTLAWELAMLPKSRCPVAQVRFLDLTFLYRLSSSLNLLSDRLRQLELSSARSHADILTNAPAALAIFDNAQVRWALYRKNREFHGDFVNLSWMFTTNGSRVTLAGCRRIPSSNCGPLGLRGAWCRRAGRRCRPFPSNR